MANPSLLIIPDRYKAAKLYSQLPESGDGDFVVTRGTTATRVNASGLIESVASGVPRLDYTGGGCPSLLVEPAATNQIRNNTMEGAVTGTPGTLPTNWTLNARGMSTEVVNTGVQGGVEYIDVRFFGDKSIAGQLEVTLESNTQIPASVSQVWSFSSYLALIAGAIPSGTLGLVFTERNDAGGSLAEERLPISQTSTLARYSATRTNIQALTAFINVRIAITNIGTFTGADFTIRIGLPQMELGSVATSVIKTSTTAITRNADVVSLSSVSGLIGQTQGTIYVEMNNILGLDVPEITIDDNTNNNRIVIARTVVDGFWAIFTASAGVGSLTAGTTTGNSGKFALAYSSAGYVLYRNGVQVATRTAALPVSLSAIRLNGRATSDLFGNKKISAAALYTSRLSDSELISLTSL